MRLGEHDSDIRIAEHERKSLLRIIRVQRQIPAARLQNGQQRDDQINVALHQEGDCGFPTDAQSAQMMGQLVSPLVNSR